MRDGLLEDNTSPKDFPKHPSKARESLRVFRVSLRTYEKCGSFQIARMDIYAVLQTKHECEMQPLIVQSCDAFQAKLAF